MTDKKRVAVTLSSYNYEKLEETAARYGITVNAFMAFVLGQWVDNHYEEQKAMSNKVNEVLSSPDEVLSNPQILEMVKEILKSDEDFKNQLGK
ncbi:hypothetical protein [Paraliobacillus ryukyuensis]|uniref:hypothetical protein n=1 Tax=Paraliobacillus ryukyuensis TaxID=200904 RepID=UPI0009A572FF|nr:hypothetical protein [Paraliobacillus ryukyuensis]